jgi:uncharacterized iron-regulated membrane protein
MKLSLQCLAGLAFLIAPALAEEQSWSKRTPPPVKYAAPPAEQKQHDWSGFHMGVNAGAGISANERNSAVPSSSTLSR